MDKDRHNNYDGYRFWLKLDHQSTWDEVDIDQFVNAERSAGFRSKFGRDDLATGGFSSGPLRGSVTYYGEDLNAREQAEVDKLLESLDRAVTEGRTVVRGRSGRRMVRVDPSHLGETL